MPISSKHNVPHDALLNALCRSCPQERVLSSSRSSRSDVSHAATPPTRFRLEVPPASFAPKMRPPARPSSRSRLVLPCWPPCRAPQVLRGKVKGCRRRRRGPPPTASSSPRHPFFLTFCVLYARTESRGLEIRERERRTQRLGRSPTQHPWVRCCWDWSLILGRRSCSWVLRPRLY